MLDFLLLNPETAGLEISQSYLRIVELKQTFQGILKLSSWGEVQMEPGIIVNGELKKEKEFCSKLKELQKNIKGEKLKNKKIIFSLEEEKGFLQPITLPEMKKKFLTKAVYFEAENHIPLKNEQACLDFEIISKNEVLLAAYPKKIVESFLSCLKKTGWQAQALEIDVQAISRALLEQKKDALIIDFKETKAVIIVYSQGSIRFTTTLGKENLESEINKALVYAQSPKIILNNNDNSLKEKLENRGFLVKLADPWKKIICQDFDSNKSSYTTALGLALRNFI